MMKMHFCVFMLTWNIVWLGCTTCSNLQVTALDLNNHTSISNASSSNLPPTEKSTTLNKVNDGSSRSEIYKMHNNGLMLLHAQRAHFGLDAKKSETMESSASNTINYHVRKRNKNNDTDYTVTETEKHLEAKFGDLPQVHQKRSLKASRRTVTASIVKTRKGGINPSPVPFIPELRKEDPCLRSVNKKTAECNKGKVQSKNNKAKHRWRSVVQGENVHGDEVKKSKIYPQSIPKRFKKDLSKSALDILSEEEVIEKSYKVLTENSRKKKRLRRALSIMGSIDEDDPLYDTDQPEETLKREFERRSRRHHRHKLGQLYNRGLAEGLPAIPPIPDIKDSFDKVDPLDPYPRFPDFRSAVANYPRFGKSDLELLNFPRFGEPRMDLLEQVPGIPRIRPLSRGDEVTGDRRGFPIGNDFVDEELEESVEHIRRANEPTPPTPIPYLTDIPSITDIPPIKPIPAAQGKPSSTGGVNGKMPVVQEVNTNEGKETYISA